MLIGSYTSPRGVFSIHENRENVTSFWYHTDGGMYSYGPVPAPSEENLQSVREAAVAEITQQIQTDDADI